MTAAADIRKFTFVAGELGKILHGRHDLARHADAVKTAEGFVVLYEGGLTRAPGTMFVGELKDESQKGHLVPFDFGDGASYQLVVNDGLLRVVYDGAYVLSGASPYETAVPWPEAALDDIRHQASGDTLFVGCKGYQPQKIVRQDHDDWQLSTYIQVNGPSETQNLDETKTITASAATGTITLTADFDIFEAGHVGGVWRLDEQDLSVTPLWQANETGLTVGTKRRNNGLTYQVTVAGSSGVNAPAHEEGSVSAGGGNVTWQYLHATAGTVRITGVTDARAATAEVQTRLPDDVVTNGTYRWFKSAWDSVQGWPHFPRLHGYRMYWFRSEKAWGTIGDDYYDFIEGDDDDDAVTISARSPDGKQVEFRWAMSAKILVAGGANVEWLIRPQNAYDELTPTNRRLIDDADEGSAWAEAVRVSGGIVFIGKSRERLHYVSMDLVAEELRPEELTAAYRHMFRTKAGRLAWQRDPNKLLWATRGDGQLVATTLNIEQKVIGMTRRPMTNGVVEDISITPSVDGLSDEITLIVRREINGQTRRYIEKMMPFFQADDDDENTGAAGAWFFDCALRYQGAATKTITGLGHLEGLEVGALVDGKKHPRCTVASGQISLDFEGEDVLVGIPLPAKITSLPLEITGDGGSTQSRKRKIGGVTVDVYQTIGGEVAANDGKFYPLHFTGQDIPASAPTLQTGPREVQTDGRWGDEATVSIIPDDGMPMTIRQFTAHAEFGG